MNTGELRLELVLTGGQAGKTMRINNLDFVNGSCFVEGNPQNVAYAIAYYASFAAYPRGSVEYQEAVKADGQRNSNKTPQSGNPETLPSPVQRNGDGPATQGTIVSGGDAKPAAGSAGLDSSGSGLQHPGVSLGTETGSGSATKHTDEVSKRIAAAVKQLDPANDEHWTDGGLPRLTAVAKAYGSEGVTRQDVVDAIDWDRDKATAALVHAL